MRNSQATLQQVEFERPNAGHADELAPDQPFFRRTVHAFDGEHRSGGVFRRVDAFGLHADLAQRPFHRLEGVQSVAHGERAPHQVEVQADHAFERSQAVADKRFFGGAVHVGDAEHRGIRGNDQCRALGRQCPRTPATLVPATAHAKLLQQPGAE